MTNGLTSVFYGFHVYNDAIQVPFITPRLNGIREVTFPTSHRQFKEILLEGRLEKKPFVFSDTQYYLQAYRRLAIIKDQYKYIYNKFEDTEEFYDFKFDPEETLNLVIDFKNLKILESHRHRLVPFELITFYPYREQALVVYHELQEVKRSIWRKGKWYQEIPRKVKAHYRNTLYYLKTMQRGVLRMPF